MRHTNIRASIVSVFIVFIVATLLLLNGGLSAFDVGRASQLAEPQCSFTTICISESKAASIALSPTLTGQAFRDDADRGRYAFSYSGTSELDCPFLKQIVDRLLESPDGYLKAALQQPFEGCAAWKYFLIETEDAPFAVIRAGRSEENKTAFYDYVERFRVWQVGFFEKIRAARGR